MISLQPRPLFAMVSSMDDLIEVTRTEMHHWPTCLCGVCEQERKRRMPPANTPIKKLSPEHARILGYRKAARHGVTMNGEMPIVSVHAETVTEMGPANVEDRNAL